MGLQLQQQQQQRRREKFLSAECNSYNWIPEHVSHNEQRQHPPEEEKNISQNKKIRIKSEKWFNAWHTHTMVEHWLLDKYYIRHRAYIYIIDTYTHVYNVWR